MARCVDGHETKASDFCDVCGMPVVEETPVAVPEEADVLICPNCGAPRQNNSLFCESCGYDYTTGALPQQDLRTELGLPPTPPVKNTEQSDTRADSEQTPAAGHAEQAGTEQARAATDAEQSPSSVESKQSPAAPTDSGPTSFPQPSSVPTGPVIKHIPWVAEVWVDPQWYAFQESTDPMPPQGPPRIVPLKESALIGRHSASRNIHPDIDCDQDTGCSRRQAYLTSADGYWYINDLDSANGTFVAPATASLPDDPITSRIQITPDMRIYVGAWTRIVVRPAIEQELQGPSLG